MRPLRLFFSPCFALATTAHEGDGDSYQVLDFRVSVDQTSQKLVNLDTRAPRRLKRRVQIDVSSLLHQPTTDDAE